MRDKVLEHRFVERFPDVLEPGVLYVSLEYGSAAHSCCCGCGEEVVTPLTPTDWNITYDGEAITLHPSVGNWTLNCRSHYVIRRGKVIEAPSWTDAAIAAQRRRDRQAKALYFNQETPDSTVASVPNPQIQAEASGRPDTAGWRQRLSRWWRGKS
jgi:hypothetical protein